MARLRRAMHNFDNFMTSSLCNPAMDGNRSGEDGMPFSAIGAILIGDSNGNGEHIVKRTIPLAILAAFALMAAGCSPKVGSKEWCKQMQEKPKGDWTANETADYAKYCIFK